MTLASEAVELTQFGFSVFPLRPNRKDPAIKGGFTNATTEAEAVEYEWSLRPNMNVGIATGGVSNGLVVIDCDYHPEDGRDGLSVKAEWEREHGDFPETVCVETPTGGEHYYFRSDEPFNCSTNADKAIDIRADGGYVVAPPSIHPNGRPYAWINAPEDMPIADVDENVKAFIRSVQHGGERKPKFQLPEVIGKGQRNDTIFKLACSLQSQGLEDDQILIQLNGVNQMRCHPALPVDEVEKIFQQAISYSKGEKKDESDSKPRKVPHNVFGAKLIKQDHACWIDGAPAVFDGRRYATGWNAVQRAMLKHFDGIKQSDQREVCHYLTLMMEDRPAADPSLIGFTNGVYDMYGDGTLRPFDPDIVITNIIPHEWNPDAYDETVDKFLDDVSCGDKAIRMNLEEAIGLCMYRSAEFGTCPILLGEGSNGKSTYIDALRFVLGTENTSSLDIGVIGKQFQTGRLLGKLANLGDDISNEFLRGDTLSIFKKVVTGDRLYTDVKGTDGFEFKPYCTLVFSANEMPNLGDYSKGMLRRLTPIPFDAYFDADSDGFDPYIGRKLKTEQAASYLCKLGVMGLQRIIAQNSMTPNQRSRDMVREVQLENDNVAAWIDEAGITRDFLIGKTTTEVYNNYSDWCLSSGTKRVGKKRFGRKLSKQQQIATKATRHNGKGVRVYADKDDISDDS